MELATSDDPASGERREPTPAANGGRLTEICSPPLPCTPGACVGRSEATSAGSATPASNRATPRTTGTRGLAAILIVCERCRRERRRAKRKAKAARRVKVVSHRRPGEVLPPPWEVAS